MIISIVKKMNFSVGRCVKLFGILCKIQIRQEKNNRNREKNMYQKEKKNATNRKEKLHQREK